MTLVPQSVRARLMSGCAVAAEVPAPILEHRAFVLVIPLVPLQTDQLELWSHAGTGAAWLRDAAAIAGYEIRYIQHHAQYTDEVWGMDYDRVLADPTTRVRRIVVDNQDMLARALAPWLTDLSHLGHPDVCDSSLVTSPLDGYLNQGVMYPHLSQP